MNRTKTDMKKEYLILIVLILGLSTYLVMKKDNQVNYTLPSPIVIDQGKIDRLEVTHKGTTLELYQEKGKWLLGDDKFPADLSAVNNMLDIVRNLRISTLISQSQDLIRYRLDNENAITVKAFAGKDELIALKVGKTAPSANHTFVMLANDTNVYQADKNFRNFFDTSMDTLRDKQVLTLEEKSLNKIILEKDGMTQTLSRKKEEKEQPSGWTDGTGSAPDKEAVTNLISSLSQLEAQRFTPDLSKEELEKGNPVCKIILENNSQIVLNLFDLKNGEQHLAGTSSQSPYAFILESYKGEDILEYVDKLAGIEPLTQEAKTDKD